MEMVDLAKVHGKVEMYTIHPLSQPDVIAPPPEENVEPSEPITVSDEENVEPSDEEEEYDSTYDIRFDDSEEEADDDFFGQPIAEADKGDNEAMREALTDDDLFEQPSAEADDILPADKEAGVEKRTRVDKGKEAVTQQTNEEILELNCIKHNS